ncbi:HAD family hydrolase [Burkholderia cepacia]|uniref:HAD family hydrolase n=1 Tax=Burkholderia cepacia TaxID=292 RepID=UPI003A5BA3C3
MPETTARNRRAGRHRGKSTRRDRTCTPCARRAGGHRCVVGVDKPDARFFERIVAETNGIEPSRIAYVGDRLDNDVEPARRAGMVPVFLRRGPWAIIQSGSGRFASPVHAIDSLSALPALLSGSLGT